MTTYSKVIPFPMRMVPKIGFNAGVYPRFAKAFGDRGNAPVAAIGQAKQPVALVTPSRTPPWH